MEIGKYKIKLVITKEDKKAKFYIGFLLRKKIIKILKQGFRVQAIKVYKETTGKGLLESKLYVDKLQVKHNILPKYVDNPVEYLETIKESIAINELRIKK